MEQVTEAQQEVLGALGSRLLPGIFREVFKAETAKWKAEIESLKHCVAVANIRILGGSAERGELRPAEIYVL